MGEGHGYAHAPDDSSGAGAALACAEGNAFALLHPALGLRAVLNQDKDPAQRNTSSQYSLMTTLHNTGKCSSCHLCYRLFIYHVLLALLFLSQIAFGIFRPKSGISQYCASSLSEHDMYEYGSWESRAAIRGMVGCAHFLEKDLSTGGSRRQDKTNRSALS